MAKSKKQGEGNTTAPEFNAYVSFPGVEYLTGTLVKVDDHVTYFRYKKSGSQTQILRPIPNENIITLFGTVGQEAEAWIHNPHANLFTKGKRDRPIPVDNIKTHGPHLMRGSSPDFGVILLNNKYARIVSEIKSAEGGGRGRKAKAKPEEKKSKEKPPAKKTKNAGGKWE